MPLSHGVLECNDSATSWVDRKKYLFYKVVTPGSESSVTCLPAQGLQAYNEAVVCVESFYLFVCYIMI